MSNRSARGIPNLGFRPRSRSNRRLIIDSLVIFGVALTLRISTLNMQLFERFYDYSRAHEDWQIDEIMVTFAILNVAFIAFGVRRIQDQRRELNLRLAAEMHATMLALQDPLTGLPNRRRFQESLSSLDLSKGEQHAILVVDLDSFKPVNDIFGHAIGDEALRTVARRLKTLGDERVICARLGGDEFALIIRNLTDPDEPRRIAAKIISAIEIPIAAAGTEHRLDASVGISIIDKATDLPEEYLRRADVALYRAKEECGSAYVFYDAAMDLELRNTLIMERELRAALAANQVVPNYQPIVDLRTGVILKFEALARWRHLTRGAIPPALFIPLAESRGLIAELTDTILRRACRDALDWPANVMLSVNLSPLLLQSKAFGLRLVTILEETRFPASRLEVEVTEQALKTDLAVVKPFLDNLRALGVRIALDDFGTGYSSLSRLRQLPFDDIKIDGSFIQSMERDTDGANFVSTILQLGQGLRLTVTAEGIESPEQRDRLIAKGCTQGQGFLFSEALPANEALALLNKGRRAANG